MTDKQYVISKSKFFEQISHTPHSKQHLYHNSEARFRVAVCGRRFGKSWMAARDREPLLFQPNTLGQIIGPTYDLADKEFRVIWNDLMIGKKLARDKRVKRAYNKRAGDMFIQFPWGTRIECRSAQHPENLVGEGLDWVIMSEAAKQTEETWDRYVRPALADKRGTADFVTTPEGQNWVYDLWRRGQDPNQKEYESWRFPAWLNPYVYPGGEGDPEIALLRRTMSTEAFDQEIAALFTAFVGRIYPEFAEETHVIDYTFNPEWPNYMCFDWGYTNPLAAIEFQVSPDDTVYVWRQHYKSYLTLGQHIGELKQREDPDGYHITLAFGDSADPDAIETVTMEFTPCVGDPEAKQNWRQGVELVKSFLAMRHDGTSYDDYERPIEQPGLFVDRSCVDVIKEFNNYRRKTSNLAVIEHNTTGVAQKQNDHAMDAIRYGLMHVFELGYNGEHTLTGAGNTKYGSAQRPVVALNGSRPRNDRVTMGKVF